MLSKNKGAGHKAFALRALIPLLMFTDRGSGTGHGGPLKLLCLAVRGFSQFHGLSFFVTGQFGSCTWWAWCKLCSPAHVGA